MLKLDKLPCRVAFRVIEKGERVETGSVVSTLLRSTTLNLWGMGAALIGLQASLENFYVLPAQQSTSAIAMANGETTCPALLCVVATAVVCR